MKPKVGVLVTVDDKHHDFQAVAQSLQTAGLEQIEAMPFSGIIGGVVGSDIIDRLKRIPGVQAVELQPTSHAI